MTSSVSSGRPSCEHAIMQNNRNAGTKAGMRAHGGVVQLACGQHKQACSRKSLPDPLYTKQRVWAYLLYPKLGLQVGNSTANFGTRRQMLRIAADDDGTTEETAPSANASGNAMCMSGRDFLHSKSLTIPRPSQEG